MSESRSYHSDAASNFSEGLRLLRTGDYEAAAQEFSAAIALDPDHWTAYFRRAEAYRNLGMVEKARGDLARAEFLMAAVPNVGAERGTPLDGTVADISAGAVVGRVVGVIVGAVAGFAAGCIMGLIYLCVLTGPAGAIFGGVAGYRAGGGDFGCAGGCLAVIAVWFILIVIVVAAAMLS